MKYTVNSIARIRTNKNRVFRLSFLSKQVDKLDMLAMDLPPSLQRSETGSGYNFLTNERDYTYSVRGYKRANAIVAFFTASMPRIMVRIEQSGMPLPSDLDQRTKKPIKKPAATYYKLVGSKDAMKAFKQMMNYPSMRD